MIQIFYMVSKNVIICNIMKAQSQIINPKQQKSNQNKIQIDQTWISSSVNSKLIDLELITCPICYGIPLNGIVQCVDCGRLFCQSDFRMFKGKHNSCPLCKANPFKARDKLHILYRSIFENIEFDCKICNEKEQKHIQDLQKNQQNDHKLDPQQNNARKSKTFSKLQLFNHINKDHNTEIIDFRHIYDYQIHWDKKQHDPIIFDKYQNMEINYRISQLRANQNPIIHYQLNALGVKIDTQNDLVISREFGGGKLIKRVSKMLQSNVQYPAWEAQLDVAFKFYNQNEQILFQKQYQAYLKNPMLNQFTFDIDGKRYRMCFKKMMQINTYSEFPRMVKRSIIKFK